RFYPDKTRSEGFFCAVFRKPGDSEQSTVSGNKKNRQEHLALLKPKEKEPFRDWISDVDAQVQVKFREDHLMMSDAD
ncbi:UNVERIFIED_CONTAM: hypothetical protein IGO34_37020, partial [Salmonella enterica subsp. enterica serovar Weltevreden]